MPTTTTLSVTRTFMSAPSRDLIISIGPSTLSMVPRMRTVCGCWAHAADPSADITVSAATSVRGINEEIFGMTFPSQGVSMKHSIGKPRGPEPIPRPEETTPTSHRRRQAVAADADAGRFERAVRQLLHEGDDLGAGLQLGFVGRNIGHNRAIRRDHDFLLTILVLDQQRVTVIAGDTFRHRRIGHGRVGTK